MCCFFSKMRQFFRHLADLKLHIQTNDQSIGKRQKNSQINIYKFISNSKNESSIDIHLSDIENQILNILAEGAHGVPALDEQGIVIQVNLYGHPDVDTIDPVADSTLNAYRKLLRYGLVSESFETGKREYLITDKGRNRINLLS